MMKEQYSLQSGEQSNYVIRLLVQKVGLTEAAKKAWGKSSVYFFDPGGALLCHHRASPTQNPNQL